MRRSSLVPLGILAVVIAGAVAGWRIYWPIESQRYLATRSIERSRSVITLVYTVTHERGPIKRERLTFTNVDGKAEVAYEGTNMPQTEVARFTEPVDGYEVANLFGEVVRDGVWDLKTAPPRGDTTTTYTISVYQLTNGRSGSHSFSFTDPHWWATTAGRQYHIRLDKNKPVPDILKLDSTSIAEPRYDRLVRDFEAFAPPGFRATLSAARAKLRAA
jgi:hypothetical protein